MKRARKIVWSAFKFVVVLAVVLFCVGYFVFQTEPFGGNFEGERVTRMQSSPAYMNGRFENDPVAIMDSNLIANIKLYMGGQVREPQFEVPIVRLEKSQLDLAPSSGLTANWFGHSSVLIEIEGVRIMTDPVLSEYASPFEIGPKRLHRTPIPLSDV
ncbi:MAG: hypothetical protein V4692_01780, partial [Bdellovibrionota bacterium]